MGETTAIEWCDHTFSGGRLVRRPQPQPVSVHEPVAAFAKRNAVANIKAQVGMVGKTADVVGVQVPTLIVAAVATCKSVSQVNIIAPALKICARSQSAPLDAIPVYVARRILTTGGIRSSRGADLCARLSGVFFADAVAGLSLHRRNERRFPLQPSLPNNLTAGKRSVSHG